MALSWDHPYGNAQCDGLIPVETGIAEQPSHVITDIGIFPIDSGPVVAPDGTVYVTSADSMVRAYLPDGTLRWSATVGGAFSITTPAVIDAYGSVYVVSWRGGVDHTTNPVTDLNETVLCRFTSEGTLVWRAAFPTYYTPPIPGNGVYSSAPPNIWVSGTDEVIMVPATQYTAWGSTRTLFAFAPDNGAVLGQASLTDVNRRPPDVTGSDFSDLFPTFVHGTAVKLFPPNTLRQGVKPPQAGVAIFGNPSGGTPFIIGTDGIDVVGLTFDLAGGFTERFRSRDSTPTTHGQPAVLSDGHSVVGTVDGRLRFAGPNGTTVPDISGLDSVVAPICRMADGTIITLGVRSITDPFGSTMSVIRNNELFIQTRMMPQAVSAPAASLNHIFLNLANCLFTIDAQSLNIVAASPWIGNAGGGGCSSPAIGPNGEVYAIASNQLYMWPGKRVVPRPQRTAPMKERR